MAWLRRATDRAARRMEKAKWLDDRAGYLIALGQYEAARARRVEWAAAKQRAEEIPV